MGRTITDLVSIWDGVVRGETIYLLAGSDKLTAERAPHSMLIEFRGKPAAIETINWTARDIAPDPDYPDGVIVMGLQGEMARFRQGRVEVLPSIAGSASPRRGTMLYLGEAAGELMACGGNQQVYRYTGNGHWIPFGDGLTRPADGGLSQFEFVVGSSIAEDLYTGGARGEAWRRDAQKWKRLDMPVNVRLIAATLGPDRNWWIAGQLGTILRGAAEVWEVLHREESISYFWDLAFLGDRLFLSTHKVLYEWTGEELRAVNFADESLDEGPIPFSFYKLAVQNDRVYSFGAKDVLCSDGQHWQRII
jgi:hypothetical protein